MINIKEELLEKEIMGVYNYARRIVDKGTIGEMNMFRLVNILEVHQRIKIYLEELEYALSKDIPIDCVIEKAMRIKRAFISEYKLLLKGLDDSVEASDYIKLIEFALNELYSDEIVRISSSSTCSSFSVQISNHYNYIVKGIEKLIIDIVDDGTLCIEAILWKYRKDIETEKILDCLNQLDEDDLSYKYEYDINNAKKTITMFTTINLNRSINTLQANTVEETLQEYDIKCFILEMVDDCINNVLFDIQMIKKKLKEQREQCRADEDLLEDEYVEKNFEKWLSERSLDKTV